MVKKIELFPGIVANITEGNPDDSDWHPILPVPESSPPLNVMRVIDGAWKQPDAVWAYHNSNGALIGYTCRWNQSDGLKKEFCFALFCEDTKGRRDWRQKHLKKPRPLYGLRELAQRPHAAVVIVEGEKTSDAARVVFPECVIVTSIGGSKNAEHADWSVLRSRQCVLLISDADEPGRFYVNSIVRILNDLNIEQIYIADGEQLSKMLTDGSARPAVKGWDLANAIEDGCDPEWVQESVGAVCRLITPEFNSAMELSVAVDHSDDHDCAQMNATDEDVRLAEMILPVEPNQPSDTSAQAPSSERRQPSGMFKDVEPWPEHIDGRELLDTIEKTVARFIICEPQTRVATTLWIAFTWFIDDVHVAPLAIITAPEKRCGKSQLLDFIGRLSLRPLVAANISPAAVFRVIEAHAPTLLIDEADSFLRSNDDIRGILNSGHTQASAYVIRNVGPDHEPTQFSTWGAKVLCGIGTLQDTLMDRAVILELRRKLPSENIERLRHAEEGLFGSLARQLARFAKDNAAAVRASRPALPDELNDRAQDNWEPLLAIADVAGGEWPTKARSAALLISGSDDSTISGGAELLADVKAAFESDHATRLSTATLLERLISDPLGPWATYNRGKPFSARQLAKKLKEYNILGKKMRIGGPSLHGFERAQFEDAWSRYLVDPSPEA